HGPYASACRPRSATRSSPPRRRRRTSGRSPADRETRRSAQPQRLEGRPAAGQRVPHAPDLEQDLGRAAPRPVIEELEREARGEQTHELRALGDGRVLAREEDRVAGREVLPDTDGGGTAGGAAAGVRDDRRGTVVDAPARGARTRAPVDLLVVREEA